MSLIRAGRGVIIHPTRRVEYPFSPVPEKRKRRKRMPTRVIPLSSGVLFKYLPTRPFVS